jgi:UDP-perosamine 4-acetyltransferase
LQAKENEIRVDTAAMTRKAIIVGAGGQALSLVDAAHGLDLDLLGCVAPRLAAGTGDRLAHLGTDLEDTGYRPDQVLLLNGIGSAGPIGRRRLVYLELLAQGWQFLSLVHRAAVVSPLAGPLGNGHQVLAGGVINAGVRLGDNVLVNSGAIVEHGCRIGSHSHVASGATVCGDCVIGESVHIGAGATLIQGIEIGFGAVIAAGAVVTADVKPLTLVAGMPARRLRAIDDQELA